MNGTRNETILAQERLHLAIFIVPIFMAMVAALPTFFSLLMVHLIMSQVGQVVQLQTGRIDRYLSIFALFAIVLPTAPALAITLVAYLKSTVILTNRRLTYRTGLISIVKGELPLENVDAMVTVDPLLGRVFGYGSIIVTSVGGLPLKFHYIQSPGNFYQILNKAVTCVKRSPEEQPVPPGKGKMAFSPHDENDDSRYMPKG
ncbi:MAG TPA: PH domain-containing protein [Verrucomicrobiae bacterium]|jgi:uncharacterized membrane protein YdbT with pleckstrin-like domain|nr:PH domain-containing protein [Verrucomicrobiae bacterium]